MAASTGRGPNGPTAAPSVRVKTMLEAPSTPITHEAKIGV